MAQARTKASQTDRMAQEIAAVFAKGQLPRPTSRLELYLDNSSGEVFAALDGFVRHMIPGEEADPLSLGYLFLLQGLLERLRYRSDCGYQDAVQLIAEVKRRIAGLATAGRIDGRGLTFLAGILHDAKIPASPELLAAAEQVRFSEPLSGELPADVEAALEIVLESYGGDSYLLAETLAEMCHALPGEARAVLATGLAQSQNAGAQDAAVLLLLDPDKTVRRRTAAALESAAGKLSPVSLRRLIAIRGWRPDEERPLVDAVVRAARTHGTDCAPWDTGNIEAMHATAIDGSGAQGFLVVSPAGRRKRLSAVMVRAGISDAWATPPQSRRQIAAALAGAADASPTIEVSRAYFDRLIRHHLASGLAQGIVPPAGLLQVAETLGAATWQPTGMDWREALDGLIAEIPAEMLTPSAVDEVLRDSAMWADLDAIAKSWFEDDPEIARLVSATSARNRARAVQRVLQTIQAHRRDRWAEHFLRTALWIREAPEQTNPPWGEFAILARALAEGQDFAHISVMHEIARRTVAVLSDPSRAPGRMELRPRA